VIRVSRFSTGSQHSQGAKIRNRIEESQVSRRSGVRTIAWSAALGFAGVLPLLIYIGFGPADGNPIGPELLAAAAVPIAGMGLAAGLIMMLVQLFRPRGGIVVLKILGVLIGLYTLYAAIHGEVYAKSGVWGRTISRVDSPEFFWVVITIYAGLSVALTTVF